MELNRLMPGSGAGKGGSERNATGQNAKNCEGILKWIL